MAADDRVVQPAALREILSYFQVFLLDLSSVYQFDSTITQLLLSIPVYCTGFRPPS